MHSFRRVMLAVAVSSAAGPGCFFTLADPVQTDAGPSAGNGGTGATSGEGGCEFFVLTPDAAQPQDVIAASKLPTGSITIDGMGDDWPPNFEWHSIAQPCASCSTTQSPLPQVLDPSVPPAEDLSARFRVGWDDSFLYLFVEVVDDDVVATPATEDIGPLGNAAKQDAVELMIGSAGPPPRLDGGRVSIGYSDHDFQMFFAVDGTVERPNQDQASPSTQASNAFKATIGTSCYAIEIRLSWSYLMRSSDVSAIGFVAAVDDWDNVQTDGGFTSKRQSHLFSSDPGDRYWSDVGGFGTLTLMP